MSNTTKTNLGLDLIDISSEKLAESRIKISSNFQLIDGLFKSDVFDVRYYTKDATDILLTDIIDTHYTKDATDILLTDIIDTHYTKDATNEFHSIMNDESLDSFIISSLSNLEKNELQEQFNHFILSKQYSRIGEIVTTSGINPFNDCLVADGRVLNRIDFPQLFNFAVNSGNIVPDAEWANKFEFSYSYGDGITTFRLPDYRGMFMRGLSMGKIKDENRVVGSLQNDTFKSHTHTELVRMRPIFAAGASRLGVYNDGSGDMVTSEAAFGNQYKVAGLVGGNETRPANGAVVYCIKYK